MWSVKNSSALIGGKFIFTKNPLQDLLSSVNAVISTNERIEFITGHITYNPAYTWILQTTTTFMILWLFDRKLTFQLSSNTH